MAMEGYSVQVPLPQSVEQLLNKICIDQNQIPPDARLRQELASLGEAAALEILQKISKCKITRSLGGFIMHMIRLATNSSPQKKFVLTSPQQSPSSSHRFSHYGQGGDDIKVSHSPVSYNAVNSTSSSSRRVNIPQFVALGELEFRKAFLILSYIGGDQLEKVVTADQIRSWKDLPMGKFESEVWKALGQKYIDKEDRQVNVDWDPRKTHMYHCYVSLDGSCRFKGPFLTKLKTHLQNVLGDDSVLMVKFSEDASDPTTRTTFHDSYAAYNKIAKEGILVGLRLYRFFVFKDGGKEEKKKNPTTSAVKCYFVLMESDASIDKGRPYELFNKTVYEARCLFMHVHMVSSVAAYMARFSLILSKTISLNVDLSSVHLQRIQDIYCRDEDGFIITRDGKPLIHTDGTGFISEDLASECPNHILKGQFVGKGISTTEELPNKILEIEPKFNTQELPLLIQFRLFNDGCAVKGTFLINKQLPPRTVQVRDSMVKVESDSKLSNVPTANSLEIVTTSNLPKKTYLSRNLIALLSYGGVPKEYFMNLLTDALSDVRGVLSKKRSALRVSINNGEMDDFMVAKMILSGIPLEESYLQYRLSILLREEKKSLRGGRLHLHECYYLMGTADPTGILEKDEVCIILENGQISGKVLVYRNPGSHFGDIHVLKATYVKMIESVVGNAKYAIFFSSKGPRNVGDEIAGGDFDGDLYWVSRNPELLEHFTASEPWTPVSSVQGVENKKPTDFSADELEDELFKLFLTTRFQPSYSMGVAADCWLALMDRLLTLGDDCIEEKNIVKSKVLRLADIYYDVLDAPKKGGRKIEVPSELKVEKFPHFLERVNSYSSTSILGLIFDTVNQYLADDYPDIEVQKLQSFEGEIPHDVMKKWRELYEQYRLDMAAACCHRDPEAKRTATISVIKKYKQILYGASELEESPKKEEEIHHEALAIYHISYDYADGNHDVSKCSFAWRVAGSALCKLYASKQGEINFICLPSVLREVFN